jgi:hypothetical protein
VWLWYRHAAQLQQINGIHNFGLSRTFSQLWSEWRQPVFWITNFTQHPFDIWLFPVFSGLALGAAGFFSKRSLKSPFAWAVGLTVFVYLLISGYGAAHHEYYGVIILPLLSLGVGRVLSQAELHIPVRWARVAMGCLASVLACGVYWQHSRARTWWAKNVESWQTLERFCLTELPPAGRERVRVFSDGSPQMFWFSHQFGEWGNRNAPAVSRGEIVLVDRARLWRNLASVENAVRSQGCVSLFENEVAFVCRAER